SATRFVNSSAVSLSRNCFITGKHRRISSLLSAILMLVFLFASLFTNSSFHHVALLIQHAFEPCATPNLSPRPPHLELFPAFSLRQLPRSIRFPRTNRTEFAPLQTRFVHAAPFPQTLRRTVRKRHLQPVVFP